MASSHLAHGVHPVSLDVENLTITFMRPRPRLSIWAPKGTSEQQLSSHRILDDLNIRIPHCSLTAILGASGSGKTSLLNAMAGRFRGNGIESSGQILYNKSLKPCRFRMAYLMQTDGLLPSLTVRETLWYAAGLRAAYVKSSQEHMELVDSVIQELNLEGCADTVIGDDRRGCSGGEKRRVSLGVQLLANPSVLFCDEATTGLDATNAYGLTQTLKRLTSKGRTIVGTFHQPRSEIWSLFDRVVILAHGSLIYSGPMDECVGYFTRLGHPLPSLVNPAEFVIDLAAIDSRTHQLHRATNARVETLKGAWKLDRVADTSKVWEASITSNDIKILPQEDTVSRFVREVKFQTARTFKTTLRDRMGLLGIAIEVLVISLITGWIFINLDESLSGIRSREGGLYAAPGFQGYIILVFEVFRLSDEIKLFDREREDGVVGVWSFLLSRRLAKLFLEDLPVPLIFSVIYYFMAGFRREAAQFFVFFVIMVLGQYLAVTFAMLCVCISREVATSSLLANTNYTLQTMCSGFIIQSNQIPKYVRWLKYVAYAWFTNGALYTNEFLAHTDNPYGRFYDCPYPGGAENSQCRPYTGLFIMDSLGFPTESWLWRPILILVGFTLAFNFGAAVALHLVRPGVSGLIREPLSKDESKVINTASNAASNAATKSSRPIGITLQDFNLSIYKRRTPFTKLSCIPILKNVNSTFDAGVLNVILGPSGSGKTSLLNTMAQRLPDGLMQYHVAGGRMLLGGSIASKELITSLTSYVCQDDNALLPSLTVRETLRFAALLRLPTWMSIDDKIQRSEDVLRKLGLTECADTRIGNAIIKGISGGEKRRCTIAVQILTDPKILFLDEPTSGLDAYTATSIIEVLEELAKEGRTIVLTIHQARFKLFERFSTILLLARGGHQIYGGNRKDILPYLSKLGYECPSATNPADYVIDTVADRCDADGEIRLQRLIAQWTNREAAQDSIPGQSAAAMTPAELGSLKRSMAPLYISLPLILKRSMINLQRDIQAVLARTTQVIAFSVIITLFFAPLKTDYNSIQSRMGLIQEVIGVYFIGMLQNLAVYPTEMMVFNREWEDLVYSPEAFLLGYTILEIPFEIGISLLFALLAGLATGFARSVQVFFVVAYNCFCIVNCGESVAIIFNTLFEHTAFAVNVTSALLSIALLLAGIVSIHLSPFLDWMNYLSPGKWAVGNLAPYHLRGLRLDCDENQRLDNGVCPLETGEDVLRLYGLDYDPELYLLALGVCMIVYRLVAYLVLKLKKAEFLKG